MADITMCFNPQMCPKKHTCYRFTAPPSMYTYQSYALFYQEGKECDHYWKTEEKRGRKK